MGQKPIQTISAAIAIIILAFAAGYYLAPGKVKIVEKIVERHVDTKTRIDERPDGSKRTVIIKRERSSETGTEETRKLSAKDSSKWTAIALIGVRGQASSGVLDYQNLTLSLQRDLFLGLSAGPWINLDGDFGIGLSIRF